MSPLNVFQAHLLHALCLRLQFYAAPLWITSTSPDSVNLRCPILFVFTIIVFIVSVMQSNPLLCQVSCFILPSKDFEIK